MSLTVSETGFPQCYKNLFDFKIFFKFLLTFKTVCFLFQEVEVEDRSNCAIVSQHTAPHVLGLLLGHIDGELDDTEWAVSKIKTDLAFMTQTVDGKIKNQSLHEIRLLLPYSFCPTTSRYKFEDGMKLCIS